jgi:hypothetical protein
VSDQDDPVVALLRADPRLERNEATRRHIERFKILWETGADLERLLGGLQSEGLPPIANACPAMRATLSGRASAWRNRKVGVIGSAPMGDLPELIGKQGIWTASAELDPAISVCSSRVAGREREQDADHWAPGKHARIRPMRLAA